MAAPAIAQDVDEAPETGEHPLPGVKARCQKAIDERLDDVARAQAELNGITTLTADHEQARDDIIDRTQSGLTRLSNEIEATDAANAGVADAVLAEPHGADEPH